MEEFNKVKVRIKRVDKDLPLPVYQTKGAVGFDLYIRVTTEIQPGSLAKLPCNVVIETPNGYVCVVASRSSTPFKKGLLFPHGIGVVDQDYCGENDEFLVPVYNFTDKIVTVERGERIAQGIFMRVEQAEWEEIETMEHNKTRGGFGSTG